MKWLPRASWPAAAGKLNLSVMSAAFVIFGLSLIFQAHRWHATPAYHVLLLIFSAQIWGALFLASGTAMGLAVRNFGRRWAVIASLTVAFTLTTGWALAFVVRYLTSPSTTPETWVSWLVFDYLLLSVAISVDRSSVPVRPADDRAAGDFRDAVDAALTAAGEDQRATVLRALETTSDKLRDAVSTACASYGQALHATIPAGAMPSGDLALQAIAEARNALLRAEEAYERATGRPAQPASSVPPAEPG